MAFDSAEAAACPYRDEVDDSGSGVRADDQILDQQMLADRLAAALSAGCPGSSVQLRGSLAAGTADDFSDVDLLWTVPDGQVDACARRVRTLVATVAPVASVRSDPDVQGATRRLLFVRFDDLPLFWRLDLELRTASWTEDAGRDETADDAAPDPSNVGGDWSVAESAAMNAIAAIKAERRGQPETADGLLERGFLRLGTGDPGGAWQHRVDALAQAAAAAEPRLAGLAERILTLTAEDG